VVCHDVLPDRPFPGVVGFELFAEERTRARLVLSQILLIRFGNAREVTDTLAARRRTVAADEICQKMNVVVTVRLAIIRWLDKTTDGVEKNREKAAALRSVPGAVSKIRATGIVKGAKVGRRLQGQGNIEV